MKTCPNPKCKTTSIPDDAKFCPNCGCSLQVAPSVMPNEVDYTDEYLGMSDWRATFHYNVNGKYRRFPGRISDILSSPQVTFIINCNENGYMHDLTLFHSNGKTAAYIKFGLYIQSCFDNVEIANYYSPIGLPIPQVLFMSLYKNLLDSFEVKMNQIKTADS